MMEYPRALWCGVKDVEMLHVTSFRTWVIVHKNFILHYSKFLSSP